jgi:hypothetical protein
MKITFSPMRRDDRNRAEVTQKRAQARARLNVQARSGAVREG